MSQIKDYIETHKKAMLDELIEFLKIPSVSADPKMKGDVRTAAEWLKNQLSKSGLDAVELFETAGHPMVYAEKIVDPSKPTVLVYGHDDVQPADPLELWDSPPFEPVIKNDLIYARGSCDDKGQMYMHVKAYDAMAASGGAPCNLKFMFEGEEEVGSVNLGTFVAKYKE
jgi:acetylornithine deacetylase/succinyl-diaminopimelate desuccinylase-like protein